MKEQIPKQKGGLSRRTFIGSAVAGGAAMATGGAGVEAAGAHSIANRQHDPLEEIVKRCGSEFADLRSVQSDSSIEN